MNAHGAPAMLAVRLCRHRHQGVLSISIDPTLLWSAVRRHTGCPWVLLYVARWLKAPMRGKMA